VLLVEDEASVRSMAERSLRRHGYLVHSVPTAEEALQVVAAGAPFVLLVTDVVLPGMNGHALSRQLQEQLPELRVLFMSGYTQNMIERNGVLDAGLHFLQKPFSPAELALAVRRVLASPREPR
jgi:CheY-like chemotaxis protein